jgi:uncharacterized OB-fold protein
MPFVLWRTGRSSEALSASEHVHAPVPVPDELSAPFWHGVREHRLLIQQCSDCRRFAHPPLEVCDTCGSRALAFEEVSGKGTVSSYSETVSGARHPYFVALTPYLVGFVELDEQEGLCMCSNFPGSTLDDLSIGAPVEVTFVDLTPESTIPQFRLVGAAE